jgi:hypothetical protein
MNHSWHQLSIATPGSGRARTRSGLAICEPAISELRAHVLRSGLPSNIHSHIIGHRTLDDIEACQQSGGRSGSADAAGRHFSGMTRRDLAFVHLHRPRCGRFITLSSGWSSARHGGQALNPSAVYQCSMIALTAVKLELWAGTTHPYWTSIRLGRELDAHHGRRACADLSRY